MNADQELILERSMRTRGLRYSPMSELKRSVRRPSNCKYDCAKRDRDDLIDALIAFYEDHRKD